MSENDHHPIAGAAADTHMEAMDALPLRMGLSGVGENGGSLRGRIVSGRLAVGHRVVLLPGMAEAVVTRVRRGGQDVRQAGSSEDVEIVTDPHLAATGRGYVLSAADIPPATTDQFAATIEWQDDTPLFVGRSYRFGFLDGFATAQVTAIKSLANGTEHGTAVRSLTRGQTASCNLALDRACPVEPFAINPGTGAFTLEDEHTDRILAHGRVAFTLRRADNLHWQTLKINKAARARTNGHRACILWFTGFSGSGKTTIADLVEQKLHAKGVRTMSLDGDNVRHGLNRDLGFTDADRVENIRRIAEVAKLMVDAGLVTLVSFISPFRSERQMARDLVEPGEFLEIFVDTPLAICEQRDPKGLYRKARAGQLPNFTGIDSPYEAPLRPELHLRADQSSAQELSQQIVDFVQKHG